MPPSTRAHERVPVDVVVQVRQSDGRSERVEKIANISLGGVFIEMANPPAFGTELALEFHLTSTQRTIRCKGTVVWSTRQSPDRALGRSGVGVRMRDVSIADLKVLSEFIGETLRGDTL